MNTTKTAGKTALTYFRIVRRQDGRYCVKHRGTNQTAEIGSIMNNTLKKADFFSSVEEAEKWIIDHKREINGMKWVTGTEYLWKRYLNE